MTNDIDNRDFAKCARLLALSVIAQAVKDLKERRRGRDYVSVSERKKVHALLAGGADLECWCDIAELDAKAVTEAYKRHEGAS